jgi:hypothetical protein
MAKSSKSKSSKSADSVIDVTANAIFAEALAIQSRLAILSEEARAVRGQRNDEEFRQYMLTAIGAAQAGILPRSKGMAALREAFIAAGRSKRNAQTIVEVCLNKRVREMAKQALAAPDTLDALRAAFAEYEVDSVSSLKRWLTPPASAVDQLIERVSRLEGDDAELFAAAMEAWLAQRAEMGDASDEAGDEADAA